jgi:hypothetical protein
VEFFAQISVVVGAVVFAKTALYNALSALYHTGLAFCV